MYISNIQLTSKRYLVDWDFDNFYFLQKVNRWGIHSKETQPALVLHRAIQKSKHKGEGM